MTFDEAFTKLLGHEGSYSNHSADPGGETMWGITIAVARANGYTGPMRQLPQTEAKRIYKALYWDKVQADALPDRVRYAVFDAAVNSGPGQAVRWLQRALGLADDGHIGPVTIAYVKQADHEALTRKMLAQRLRFMTNLTTWSSFSRGWARRIADLMDA
jgi:lysozyme family protein